MQKGKCRGNGNTAPTQPTTQRRSRRQIVVKVMSQASQMDNVKVPKKGTKIKFAKYDVQHSIENKKGMSELWYSKRDRKVAEIAFFRDLAMGTFEPRTQRQRQLVAVGRYLYAIRIQSWYRRCTSSATIAKSRVGECKTTATTNLTQNSFENKENDSRLYILGHNTKDVSSKRGGSIEDDTNSLSDALRTIGLNNTSSIKLDVECSSSRGVVVADVIDSSAQASIVDDDFSWGKDEDEDVNVNKEDYSKKGKSLSPPLDFARLSYFQLKVECRKRKLKVSGIKRILIQRLERYENCSDGVSSFDDRHGDNFSSMKVSELKSELKEWGLPTSGNKAELISRFENQWFGYTCFSSLKMH